VRGLAPVCPAAAPHGTEAEWVRSGPTTARRTFFDVGGTKDPFRVPPQPGEAAAASGRGMAAGRLRRPAVELRLPDTAAAAGQAARFL
jgi:hypothetical protein